MTDKQLAERRIDEAIDRAVRDIMNVEPQPDLRARVLAELDGAPTRVAFWPRLAFGGVALALAAVLVAILMPRSTGRPDESRIAETRQESTPSRPAPSRAPVPQRTSEDRRTVVRIPSTGVNTPQPGRAVEDRLIQAATIDTLAESIAAPIGSTEALHPLEPIAVAGLTPIDVQQSEIDIKPIVVEQIDIAPLSSRR
jgi:hypothetical protein